MIIVLVVGVVAVALNVLLYFGYFLPRMTPLIAHIHSIDTSLPEENVSKPQCPASATAVPHSSAASAKSHGERVGVSSSLGPFSCPSSQCAWNWR
jgi:hypothetical protein